MRSQILAGTEADRFARMIGPEPESDGVRLGQRGILVDFYEPAADNVARETLATMSPKASGVVPTISLNVPHLNEADRFALKFTGTLDVPRSGKYQFFLTSNDGSRLYIDDKQVIDNDGSHGMVEKKGNVKLSAGEHSIMVTYFDDGGNEGLSMEWSGPNMERTAINLSKTFPNEPHWAGWGVTELTSRAPFCFLHLPLQNTSLESIFPLTVDLPSGIDVLGMVNARIWVASMDRSTVV